MGFFRNWFGHPGQRHDISHEAPVIKSHDSSDEDEKEQKIEITQTEDVSFNGLKATKFDVALDWMVWVVGTQFAFFTMWIIVILWAILGGVLGATQTWQVIMQDGQSIQTYIWDTFLMRQQLIQSYEQNLVWAELRSRTATFRRLLPLAIEKRGEKPDMFVPSEEPSDEVVEENLKGETWFDKLCTYISVFLGSAPVIIIYWIGIFVWVGCGALWTDTMNTPPFTGERTGSNPQYEQWSNLWQLAINTATALVLLITSVCLQNVRARHDEYLTGILEGVIHIDHQVEARLRELTGDFDPNPTIQIKAKKRSTVVKIIDFYADIIGTGVGVIIIILVIVGWICAGHPMSWDTNWWLIIGTYTGLIGFLDGFVVRNVYYRTTKYDEATHEFTKEEERLLCEELGLPFPETVSTPDKSIVRKVSLIVNDACSSTWSVGVGVGIVILLICVASGMKWSETGQLVCNTPTMIIEGFFLLILIQAHNWADEKLRLEVASISMRRRLLLEYVRKL